VQLSFQMHRKSLVSVASLLQRTAHLAHLHVPVLLYRCLVKQCLILGFLLAQLFDFVHDYLCFFKLFLLSQS
jgi:hypothetical protein